MEKKNTLGLVGFILSIVTWVFCWIPYVNYILALAALILSIVGLCQKNAPKGFALAGVIISALYWLIIVVVIGLFVGAAAAVGAF